MESYHKGGQSRMIQHIHNKNIIINCNCKKKKLILLCQESVAVRVEEIYPSQHEAVDSNRIPDS